MQADVSIRTLLAFGFNCRKLCCESSRMWNVKGHQSTRCVSWTNWRKLKQHRSPVFLQVRFVSEKRHTSI